MSNQRFLGIHHRADGDLSTALKQAIDIGANCMQIFVSSCKTGKVFKFSKYDLQEYSRIRNSLENFEVYVHASFRVSLTTSRKEVLAISKKTILRELEASDEIGGKYLVIHPGSAKDHNKTNDDPYGIRAGVKTMADMLNQLCEKEFKTKILIENTAYGKSNVGSNLQDFAMLREHLEQPEKIGFCLDLAHSFAYGYQLEPLDQFISLLSSTMGLENIDLIHLNDSATKLASRIDQHKSPGEGYIGEKPLREFVRSKEMTYIPTILELPPVDQQEAQRAVQFVQSWLK